jgi:ferric iron reductase protein FhuF
MADVVEALRQAADLGPFFEIVTDPAEECDPTWRPLPENDPERLLGLIDAYAQRLGTDQRRVAASILFQGLASRLWSPVVVAAALGAVPDLKSLHWRWAPGAPIALWLADPSPQDGSGSAAVHATVVEGQLRPLRAAMLQVVRLADGLMWGNAASALAGTLRAGTLRPELAPRVNALVRDLLAREPLTGTGSFDVRGGFVRRSCCLYYKVPPGGEMCGDCALLPRR